MTRLEKLKKIKEDLEIRLELIGKLNRSLPENLVAISQGYTTLIEIDKEIERLELKE